MNRQAMRQGLPPTPMRTTPVDIARAGFDAEYPGMGALGEPGPAGAAANQWMEADGERAAGELGEIEVPWANPPTLAALKTDLNDASVHQGGAHSEIQRWLDNLYVEGSAKPRTREGRSAVQPKLIRKQAEWRYSALSEPFMSTDELFKASPVTWEDRNAARQNALLLNHQFNVRIDRGRLVDETVRTLVNTGTVFLKVAWVNETREVAREVPIVEFVEDPAFMETIEEVRALSIQDPNTYQREVPEELQQALQVSLEAGVPMRPEIVGTETITETKVVKNHPTAEVCDWRNITADPMCMGNLKRASFIVHSFEASMAELKKDGRYKNLDRIRREGSPVLGDGDHESSVGSGSFNFADRARKKMVVREYWGFWDAQGDGVLLPIVCAWIEGTIVRLEQSPYPDRQLPFVAIKYLPRVHELYGESDGSLLEENQKILGAVTRGMIDVMGRSANGQMAFARGALDTTNRRKFDRGEDYEFSREVVPDIRQGMHMHTYPEISRSAPYMVDLMNSDAESLTGVKAYAQGISGDALGKTATGQRGALDSASKRELGILRRISTGFVEIGRKFTSMNGAFLSEEEIVRVTNEEFVAVRRDELAGEFDLRLSISTAEEDEAKAQELAFMMQTLGNNLDFSITQMIMEQMMTLRKLPDLAKKIAEFEPRPDPVAEKMKELQVMELEAKIQVLVAQAQENVAEAKLDTAKAGTEMARTADLQAQTDQRSLDFVEQESGVKQERDLEKGGAQADANMRLEAFKGRVAQAQEAGRAPPTAPEPASPESPARQGQDSAVRRENPAGQADPAGQDGPGSHLRAYLASTAGTGGAGQG